MFGRIHQWVHLGLVLSVLERLLIIDLISLIIIRLFLCPLTWLSWSLKASWLLGTPPRCLSVPESQCVVLTHVWNQVFVQGYKSDIFLLWISIWRPPYCILMVLISVEVILWLDKNNFWEYWWKIIWENGWKWETDSFSHFYLK